MPKTYRFRVTARVTSALTILVFSTGFVGTIWAFFIRARVPSNYVWGALCLIGFGFFLRRFAGESLHCISYRLEVGDQWVAVRDIWSLTVMPFNKIVAFAEEPIVSEGKLSGYRFAFIDSDDTQILFSTQIVGWAEVIQSVHRILPANVPDVRTLDARSVLSSIELSAHAAAFTAPGDDSPESWQAAHIARWYDFWLGYLLGFALVWKPVGWLGDYLKAHGITGMWLSLVIVPAAVLPCQILSSWLASSLRRHRQKSAPKKTAAKAKPQPSGLN